MLFNLLQWSLNSVFANLKGHAVQGDSGLKVTAAGMHEIPDTCQLAAVLGSCSALSEQLAGQSGISCADWRAQTDVEPNSAADCEQVEWFFQVGFSN